MKKRQKVQLILISIGLFLILLTYFYYPNMNKDKLLKDHSVQKDLKKTPDGEQITTFESVEYEGLYDLDKPFSVKSEKAYIMDKEPDIVYMTNMHVIFYLKNRRVVNITSNKGRYNKVTQDCFFEENVRVTDNETKIFSENLDLVATKNFAKVYNNVKLNHPMGTILSDNIDYNFETKHFKVSMFDGKAVKMKVIK